MSKSTLEIMEEIEREEEQKALEQKRKEQQRLEQAQQRLAELNQQKRDFNMINAEMRVARFDALAKLWPVLIPALVEVGVLGYRQTYMDKQDSNIEYAKEQKEWESQNWHDIRYDPEVSAEDKGDARRWFRSRIEDLNEDEWKAEANKKYYDILTQIGIGFIAAFSFLFAGKNYDDAISGFKRSDAKKLQVVLATIRRGGLSRGAINELRGLGLIGANILKKYSKEYPEIIETLLRYESNPQRISDGTSDVYRWAATAIVRGALERDPMLADEVLAKFKNILELPVNLMDVVNTESEEHETKKRIIDKINNIRKNYICRVVLQGLYSEYQNTDFAEALRKTHALSDGIEGQKMDLENMQDVAQKFVSSKPDAQAVVLDALMRECTNYIDFEMGASMFFKASPELLRKIWKEQHESLYSRKWRGEENNWNPDPMKYKR